MSFNTHDIFDEMAYKMESNQIKIENPTCWHLEYNFVNHLCCKTK